MTISHFEDFNIFTPDREIIPESRRTVDQAYAENRRFLAETRPVNKRPLPITGTFIYAHPPDYTGCPTLHWTEQDWDRQLEKLKRQGMDTLVFQASVWNELQEVYYPSTVFRNYRTWNAVEPMLQSARKNGFRIFLGGYGSVSGWAADLSQEQAREEIRKHLSCLQELLVYRELFDGIYFSPETAFDGSRSLSREQKLNLIYREYFGRVKEIAGDKKILASPASIFLPDREEDFAGFWNILLEGVPLDILAPQDSVGCGCCPLNSQQELWKIWKRICDDRKIVLWANIELFHRTDFEGAAPFINADPVRIRAQRANVSPFVEKCICWEALYFNVE